VLLPDPVRDRGAPDDEKTDAIDSRDGCELYERKITKLRSR
jgi:hypothetical protein